MIRVGATAARRVALALVAAAAALASPGCGRLRARSTGPLRNDAADGEAGATMIRALGPARPSPATYTVGASRFTVELGLERPTMMVHEPALLSLVFRVPAGLEVQLFATPTDALFRPDNHAAAFVDAHGRALPQSAERGDGNGVSGWLPVDGSRTEHLIASSWVVGLTPGAYRFHVETEVRARASASDPWRAVPVAVDAPITVVPDEPAALVAALQAVGARAAAPGGGDDAELAMRQLQLVHDRRVIPEWDRIARVPSYSARLAATAALARYDDPGALAAIVRTAATSSDDLDRAGYVNDALRDESAGQVRYAAVVALAQSPCAAAYPALLAHRNDADYAVRLAVLQRIARDPRPAVIPQLESFLRDPNDVVRGEAQRLVAEHPR